MNLTKQELTRARREEVSLQPLQLEGSVWVRSLTALDRSAFFKQFAKDGQLGDGAREALLLQVVEHEVGPDTFAPIFETIEDVAAIRPDVQDVLFEVASRLSVLRETDRQAIKKAFSAVPSGASPSILPSSSGARL